MKSKIVWGVLITATAALLVAGAVNRTMARSETGNATGEQTAQQQRRGQAANGTGSASGDALGQAASPVAGNGEGNQGQGRGQQGGEFDSGTGQSAGGQGQGQGGGRGAGGGQGAGSGAEAAEPLANLDELATIQGTVIDANEELLLLAQADNDPLEISGRAWRFALENGFSVGQDDSVTVVGFYDEDHFEPIAVTNDATGQQMQLREASGRPLWAGRGQRNTGT